MAARHRCTAGPQADKLILVGGPLGYPAHIVCLPPPMCVAGSIVSWRSKSKGNWSLFWGPFTIRSGLLYSSWSPDRLIMLSLWHIWKLLAQETVARKLAQVTCKSSTWHTWKLNYECCRLKVVFLWVLLCCDSDWPITARHLRMKTFQNQTRSISESLLSQVKTCTSVCHIWKFSFVSGFRKWLSIFKRKVLDVL